MSIPNVLLNDSVKVQNNPAVVKQNTAIIEMKSSENLQRQPQEDNFNGKGLDKKKIITYASVGTVFATLVGIALDFRFAEGKHVKNLWRKLTGNAQDIKPKSNETPNVSGKTDVNTPNIPAKPDVVQPKPNVDVEPPIVKNEPVPVVESEKVPAVKIEPHKEGQVNNDIVVPKVAEPKGELKTTQSEKPKTKPKPVTETVIEKEYIDRETLSPVKEKWQGKTLLERTIKTDDGLVTKSYRNGKVESVFTNGDIQKLEVYAPNGRTVEESYFRTFGTLHVKKGGKEFLIPHVSEEQFKEAVKLSQKYGSMNVQELNKIYKEVLSGNPSNMSLFEFNILETHLDELSLTIPKITEHTSIPKHGYYAAVNYQIREAMAGNNNYGVDWVQVAKGVNKRMATLPPLEKDCIFYRGLGAKEIPQIIEGKVGDVIVPDKAFAYTSWNRHYAKEYGDGTILIIHTPKGAKVSRCNANFGEALFPSGAEYRIVSKSKTPADKIYPDGQWRIELEYILPKS